MVHPHVKKKREKSHSFNIEVCGNPYSQHVLDAFTKGNNLRKDWIIHS